MQKSKPPAICDHSDIPTGHTCPICNRTIVRRMTGGHPVHFSGWEAGGHPSFMSTKRFGNQTHH